MMRAIGLSPLDGDAADVPPSVVDGLQYGAIFSADLLDNLRFNDILSGLDVTRSCAI